ncbi:MAG TPA: YihY/virulence factor BrkB family protein [Myxococcales bacterium]|nr:YihY/virulence factor BrkB family protein [Myxococcales bacterium]
MRIAGLHELGLLGFAKALYKRWSDNAITDRAAQLAYYFVFALFPFLFFLVTLTAYLPLQGAARELLSRLDEVMPGEAMAIIRGQFDKLLTVQRPKLLTLSLALAVWSASRGVDAIRTSLNLAYDVKESRPFWKTQGMAIAITVLGAILVLVSITGIALGGKAGEWLASRVGVTQAYAVVWSWSRWPVTMLLIMFVAALLYYFLPDVEQEWRFITPGSAVGTALWLLTTWGFTQYAEHFGKYDATYGSIGGVIVLLTWLYLTGLIFILGGEINAILEHAAHEGKARGARVAGEAPPPEEARPSAAAPGAAKQRTAAVRSQLRLLRRREEHRGAASRAPEEERESPPEELPPDLP